MWEHLPTPVLLDENRNVLNKGRLRDSCGSEPWACLSAGNKDVVSAQRLPTVFVVFIDRGIATGKTRTPQVYKLSCKITGVPEKEVLSRLLILIFIFFLKPKVRTGISKPYNVKQIKTTTAEEAEEAIRCLMEAKGGEHSFLTDF